MVSAEEDILWLERGSWNTCEMKAEGDLFSREREKVGEQQRDALGEAWLIISLFKVLQEQRKSVNNKYPQLHFRIYFWHFPLARIGS